MSRILLGMILPVFVLVQGCSPHVNAKGEDGQPLRVSMIQLLASPERFEGKRIQVEGVFRRGNEERALYVSRDDAEYLNFASGLWLESTKGAETDRNGAFVVVEGTFTAAERGHLGLWAATIRNVSRIDRAKSRADYPPGM
jgi:hypothetical protein